MIPVWSVGDWLAKKTLPFYKEEQTWVFFFVFMLKSLSYISLIKMLLHWAPCRYAVKMLISQWRRDENELPNAPLPLRHWDGDSSPSVTRPETHVRQTERKTSSCSTPSCPPPWGGTSTTTRRCTTCKCSHTSSQTSSLISTVRTYCFISLYKKVYEENRLRSC